MPALRLALATFLALVFSFVLAPLLFPKSILAGPLSRGEELQGLYIVCESESVAVKTLKDLKKNIEDMTVKFERKTAESILLLNNLEGCKPAVIKAFVIKPLGSIETSLPNDRYVRFSVVSVWLNADMKKGEMKATSIIIREELDEMKL